MRKKLFLTAVILSLTSAFTGCKNNSALKVGAVVSIGEVTEEPTTKEQAIETEAVTVQETIIEETEPETESVTESEAESESLIEFTGNETNIPSELVEKMKSSIENDIGAYLYGDIDNDKEKELLAAYLDESVGQWKIIRLENENAEPEEFYSIELFAYYDRCDMGLIDLKDKVHYVINLYSSMGTENSSHILEESDSGVNEVLGLGNTVWQLQNGEVILQNTYYGCGIDKTTGMMVGRTWTYSYLTYDKESGKYKEYVANEITEDDFLLYEGASECLQGIKNTYSGFDVKISFFKRNNGMMHVQCEYENDTMILFEYYTVYYEDNKITMVTEMQQGSICKNFTSLEEA